MNYFYLCISLITLNFIIQVLLSYGVTKWKIWYISDVVGFLKDLSIIYLMYIFAVNVDNAFGAVQQMINYIMRSV